MSRDRCQSLDHHVPSDRNTYFQHYTEAKENINTKCFSQDNDNNVKYLEDLEDPQFSDLPPDSSFDEVKCIMATPLRKAQLVASSEPKMLDNLEPQNDFHRSGITAVIPENTAENPFCIYKNPPLPKDVHEILPPPNRSKDVVALIRRAKAIARLKELEKKQASLEQPKNARQKGASSLQAQRRFTRNVQTSPKFKAVATKTSKAKLFPEPKAEPISSTTKPQSRLQAATSPPNISTFESILDRISVIRSRTDASKSVPDKKKSDILTPIPQDESEELDEFEVLEELYGAVKPDRCPPKRQSVSDLQKRINILQQRLLRSPMRTESMTEKELDEFLALEQEHGGTTYFRESAPEDYTVDLQDRINTLKETLFQSPTRDQHAVYKLPTIHRYEDLQESKVGKGATASCQNVSGSGMQTPSSVLPNKIPQGDFSVEALADTGDNVSLDEITMPDFDEDISFDNFDVADITTPDLCDLSLSGYDLALDPESFAEISGEEAKDDYMREKNVSEKKSEQRGILTSVVNAVVDRLKNIFSTSTTVGAQNVVETEVELDTSLPSIFEITPTTSIHTSEGQSGQFASGKKVMQNSVTPSDHIVMPPHPKDPKNYKAMIKRAQAIQKRKIYESATAKDSAFTLPKAAPPAKINIPVQKKTRVERPAKVYPPGEYSPSYAKAVARARSLAGLKNISAVLNQNRTVKLAKEKDAKEAKLAAMEALPPIERIKEKMKSMRRDGRELLLPTEKTQIKKGLEKRSPMSPILEEPALNADLIQFSPLKPHEVQMRLRYLKNQDATKTLSTSRSTAQKQVENNTSPILSLTLSPIRLHSPSSPNPEKTRRKKVVTKLSSATTVLSGDAITDDLDDIEPPDFLDTSDIVPPRESSIPTTNEIINRIRSKIRQNLNYTSPDVQHSLFSATPQILIFPQDLPDENLMDIKTPEFGQTPRNDYIHLESTSPFEKDIRMYAWGEHSPTRIPTSIVSPAHTAQTKLMTSISKTKSTKETIIPPHPKNPKDYKAMIKRAQAIQLKKQQEICNEERPKDSKSLQKKGLVVKKRVPKPLPNNVEQQNSYDMEYLTELPPLRKKYKAAVARARLLRGLKNRAAALDEKIATKKVNKEAARIAYDASPEVEIENLQKKTAIELSADNVKISQEQLENLEAPWKSEESLDVESIKLHNFDTPKRKKSHGQRNLISEFLPSAKRVRVEPHLPSKYAVNDLVYSAVPVVYSPNGTVYRVPDRALSPYFLEENEFISNVNETPKRVIYLVRHFKDTPLDKLENEIEPVFTDISFDKPLTPPPRTSDIISRIKSKITEITQRSPPPILKFPKVLPEEDLLELSAPSFMHTPSRSSPMTWEEVQSATPTTFENLDANAPTLLKNPMALSSPETFEEKAPTHDSLIFIPPHPEDPKDYATMIRRSKAIYKLNKQKETKEAGVASQSPKTRRNDRIPISKWRRLSPKKINSNRRRKLVLRKRAKESKKMEEKKSHQLLEKKKECPTEPPPLPQHYREAVAKTRLLHGLKNRTAALNPEIAAKMATMQVYNTLPEIEKIKERMERLRTNPQRTRRIKPTIEQIAYLEALKQIYESDMFAPVPVTKSQTALQLSKTPEATVLFRPISNTQADLKKISEEKSHTQAELSPKQKYEAVHFPATSAENLTLNKLLEAEDMSQLEDTSLAEFEALEALEGPHVQQVEQTVTPLNINQLISNLRQQQLATPTPMGPTERLRQLMAARKDSRTSIASPVETPEIYYTPIILSSNPDKEEPNKHAQQPTVQITRNNRLTELHSLQDLEDIQEPSYFETTPSTPMERPRPRDIIERVRAQVKSKYRTEVPTGHLIDLRTPPRMLSLPRELPAEKLLDLSQPSFAITPQTPECSITKSPDITIPQLFQLTPSPLPPFSTLRYRTLPSETAPAIPTQPEDAEDYKTMVRRILSRIKKFKEKYAFTRGYPSLHSTLKDEMQTATQSPKSRYVRNQAEQIYVPSNFEEIPATIHSYGGVLYPSISFISPQIGQVQIDSSETFNRHKQNFAHFENLHELEELSEVEQPSYVDISKYQITNSQYLPLTPPQTSPTAPSDIIKRIRQQYNQKNAATVQEVPMLTPVSLGFPEVLQEEQIFEQSMPSFPNTPIKLQTPIMTPNISLPQYFQESPPSEFTTPIKSRPPIPGVIDKSFNLESRSLPVVSSRIKLKTSHDIIKIPSHLKDPRDVVAIIRTQIFQKTLTNEAAEKSSSSKQFEGQQTGAAAMITPPLSSYTNVNKKMAALRAKRKQQISPSARELTHETHSINRNQIQKCKRKLNESKQFGHQQGLEIQLVHTPTPPEKRLKTIKSRIAAERTTSSAYPFSPIKTPKVADIPSFQPLALPQTPLYPFLENVSITDIAGMSIQFDDFDNYTLDSETTDEDDLEFQLAEIANDAYQFRENIDGSELDSVRDDFNIAERIQMLQQQLLKSSDESDANSLEEHNLKRK